MLKNAAFAAAYDGVFVIKLSLKHLFVVELSNVSKKTDVMQNSCVYIEMKYACVGH